MEDSVNKMAMNILDCLSKKSLKVNKIPVNSSIKSIPFEWPDIKLYCDTCT